MKFISESKIRKYVNGNGKRISRSALNYLDRYIAYKLQSCLAEHDGGRKTIDDKLLACFLPMPKNGE